MPDLSDCDSSKDLLEGPLAPTDTMALLLPLLSTNTKLFCTPSSVEKKWTNLSNFSFNRRS